jgi:tripartite-type tricarboxylate transporter receptor subunit TctC
MRFSSCTTITAGLFAAVAAATGFAAERASPLFPSKPIRLIVPYAPGGGNDTMARAIGGKLTEAWGQQVIIDNRPGANGLLAGEIAAKAAPDGYTLFMANIASHAINPALYKKIPYDAVKDFAPVSLLGTTANVLVVHPSTPAKNLKELISLAKAKPGQLTYGSNGTGSSQHLAGALFGSTFGLNLVHVPYKGTGPMMNDLLGGQISMSFANMVAALPQVQSRRLVALAVTSLKRAAALQDVPSVAETAPGFEATSWWGVVATGGTPRNVVDALNREIVKGLGAPDMKSFFSRVGAEPRATTPQEFAAFIQSELAKWGKVVRDSGARAD